VEGTGRDLLENGLPGLGQVALPLAELVPRVVVVRVELVPAGAQGGGGSQDPAGHLHV
jgi:hypothetical protein